jgi:hypothetical protein
MNAMSGREMFAQMRAWSQSRLDFAEAVLAERERLERAGPARGRAAGGGEADEYEMRRVAFHEAGHAISSLAIWGTGSGAVVRVVVRPDGSGCCFGTDPPTASLRERIVTCAAGYSAADFFDSACPRPRFPRRQADTSERERSEELLGCEISPMEWAAAQEEARLLLGRHLPALRAIADQLYQHGELSGREVEALFYQ